MLKKRIWTYDGINEADIDKLSKEVGIPKLLAKIFLGRNIKDVKYIKSFLNPELNYLHDPFLMKDMEKATNRIISAIKENEKITLYGDYDVDGITGITILYDFLERQGADVTYYIPDRIEEGYGVSMNAIEFLAKNGSNLIITIDCGINAIQEVDYAKNNNVDMIITDHHKCGQVLPKAYAIINPCQEGCTYPFKELAGVGVAFKLINAICINMNLGDIYFRYLDFVAIGTVADVVDLKGENRIIVKQGMSLIPKTTNVGLKALLKVSNLIDRQIDTYEIGFVIGPRINAAGRVGGAARALEMFITKNEKKALDIAEELDIANTIRQEIELKVYEEAIEKIKTEINLKEEKIIVLSNDNWHQGVIGIVASRVMEKHYRPVILISTDKGAGKGSGRSIKGFNLFKALESCQCLLQKYGGHEMAAGLSIDKCDIRDFKKVINEYASKVMEKDMFIPKIRIDAYIDRNDLSIEHVKQLDLLSPFGIGNPSPVFGAKDLTVDNFKGVGAENKHLKARFSLQGVPIDAIGFNMGFATKSLKEGDSVNVAAKLELNTWNSITRVQLNLKDIECNRKI
jgi:single-stranded-DNA-specific exonuclease